MSSGSSPRYTDYEEIDDNELLMSENDEPSNPPPLPATDESKPQTAEPVIKKQNSSKPIRPTKIGYGSVEDMPAQHIRLFAPWIFDTNLKVVEMYKDVISQNDAELLHDALAKKDGHERIKAIFYTIADILGTDEKAQRVMKEFLEISPRAVDVKHQIYFTPPDCLPEAFFTYWDKFLNHPTFPNDIIDRICLSMPVEPILEYLKISPEASYRAVYEKLKHYVEPDFYTGYSKSAKFLAEWKIRCSILIELITAKPKKYKPEHWYCEFLKACNTSPETRAVAFVLERKFRDVLAEYDIIVSQLTKPPLKSTADFVDPSEAPTAPRPQSLFGTYPSEITKEYTQNYDLRKYQEELTKKAKEGMNTIICAPTGSGKTHVAAEIISNHLRQLRNSDKVGRAVMFVPTIPLVGQQATHLTRNLKPEFYVEKLSGAERSAERDIRKADTLLLADIVVLTPQIFINMLSSPLRSQKIYLSDFTLLVFDECHHCNEQHPYNVLMNMVRESSYKPQIVGLTASVGDGGDAKSRMDTESAMQHMIALCARLNADTVSSIRNPENLSEMHYHVSKPLDEIIPCRPSQRDDFAHEIALISDYVQMEIQDVLQTVVAEINDFDEKFIDLPLEGHEGKNGTIKTGFRYNGKLGVLKHNISKRDLDVERRHFLLKCLELLEICHFALRNNELMPASYAFEYFQERIGQAEKFGTYEKDEKDPTSKMGKYMQRLRKMINYIKEKYQLLDSYVPESNSKPIYNSLLNCIKEQHKKDPGSRIIIFVESRKGCVKMAESLGKEDTLANTFGSTAVGYIVSVNQSMANFGQSTVIQNQTLKAFRKGDINVLVATSVAEEGLDVAECSLIIKYNSVGSEKSYIQRRGRARAKNARSVLLAISTSVEQQEYNNIMREYLMNICLNELQNLSERELKTRIFEKKKELMAELEQERKRQAQRKERNVLYNLECKTCGKYLCESRQVARLMESQFICCNPQAWTDTRIEQRFQKAFSNKVSSLCGEWKCVKCNTKFGEVIKYGEAYLPTLSATGFRLRKASNGALEDNNNKPFTWKDIALKYFDIGAITLEQIRDMVNSLAEYNPEAYKSAQMNEEMGLLEAVKNLEYEKKEKIALKED